MSDREKELQDYHNKGEKDASNHEHHIPHGPVGTTLSGIISGEKMAEECKEDDAAYQAGHDNVTENRSFCFLTSACVQFAGLGDDCEQLSVMRKFRDAYVVSLPNGRALIEEYYNNAPEIVVQIQASSQKAEVLSDIYDHLQGIVKLIKHGENAEAVQRYSEMYNRLKRTYLRCGIVAV